MKHCVHRLRLTLLSPLLVTLATTSTETAERSAVDIGSRRELFTDDFIIDSLRGAELRLHHPTPREIVITYDEPHEGNTSYYVRVFRDGDKFRMYYRGSNYDWKRRKSENQVVCYAESVDAKHWTRPKLGLVESQGSKQNNIIWDGVGDHDFAPFKDENPACKPDERYKALGGVPVASIRSPRRTAFTGVCSVRHP